MRIASLMFEISFTLALEKKIVPLVNWKWVCLKPPYYFSILYFVSYINHFTWETKLHMREGGISVSLILC